MPNVRRDVLTLPTSAVETLQKDYVPTIVLVTLMVGMHIDSAALS
jgi:hypothetical protein